MPGSRRYSRLLNDQEKGSQIMDATMMEKNDTTPAHRLYSPFDQKLSTILPAPSSLLLRRRKKLSPVHAILLTFLLIAMCLFSLQMFPQVRYYLYRLVLLFGGRRNHHYHTTPSGCILDIPYKHNTFFRAPSDTENLYVKFDLGPLAELPFTLAKGSVYITQTDDIEPSLSFDVQIGSKSLSEHIILESTSTQEKEYKVVVRTRRIDRSSRRRHLHRLAIACAGECLDAKISLMISIPSRQQIFNNLTISHPFADFYFDHETPLSFSYLSLHSTTGSLKQAQMPFGLSIYKSGILDTVNGDIIGNVTLRGSDTRFKVSTVSGKVDIGVTLSPKPSYNHTFSQIESNTISGMTDLALYSSDQDSDQSQAYALSLSTVSGHVHATVPYPDYGATQLDLESTFSSVSVQGHLTEIERDNLSNGYHTVKGQVGTMQRLINGSQISISSLSSMIDLAFAE